MQALKFNRPTLVSLTAQTCGGKSYLLEALCSQFGFQRIVSTTDRAARAGEVEGVHYNFINTETSVAMAAEGKFAELVTFNGVRYGVTHDEMAKKMNGDAPPVVILEPNGVKIYEHYCHAHNWGMFKIFVWTSEDVRLERLAARTANDITNMIRHHQDGDGLYIGEVYKDVKKLIQVNNKRLMAVLSEERTWNSANTWDLIVDGTDLASTMSIIEQQIISNSKYTHELVNERYT